MPFSEILLKLTIIAPLVFLAGFIDAVAGGGGLISLPAYMIAGLPPTLARGTNKISAFMGTSLATYRYAKQGYVRWKIALFCVPFAVIGSVLGTLLGNSITNQDTFKIIMLAIIPLVALFVLQKRSLPELPLKEPFSEKTTIAIACAFSLALGIYDGFIGPGTGTFLIIVFTSLCRVSLKDANGMTKVVNLSTNVASTVTFIISGLLILPLGLIAGVFGVAGNYLGTKFFVNKGVKGVKLIIIVVLTVFFVKTLLELLGVELPSLFN